MIKRVLIANRGEIALRILRACRLLGVETVAAYTKADRELMYLSQADQRICIGARSYLDASQVVSAATVTGCDSIHPGYGFLSENADFASLVESSGMTFIGPSSTHIALMGEKAQARKTMREAGVPTLPGSQGSLDSFKQAKQVAGDTGFPVMLKASRGGGGMGIFPVADESELESAWRSVTAQAESLFGNPDVYLEKLVTDARHIEVQVMGDGAGKVVHFGARECSVQRRHQKLIEETPPPGIDPVKIDELAQRCCLALAEMDYGNAGTLEFLYANGEFYFIEMNTRIQVEHPITEAVTGIDLVEMQLKVAGGQGIDIDQDMIRSHGHAIETRITAEDASFAPSPGRVHRLERPGGPGVRFDSHLYEGYTVPHEYDSLVGKLIVLGSDRGDAVDRLLTALGELVIDGPETNIPLLAGIVRSEKFQSGRYTTDLVGELFK